MNITIIESGYHHEVVRNLILLFLEIKSNISLICSPKTGKALADVLLTAPPIEWHFIEAGAISSYLEKDKLILSKSDIVIFSTLTHQHAKFLPIAKQFPTIWIIHNIHSTLAPHTHKWDSYHFFHNQLLDTFKYQFYKFIRFYKNQEALLQMAYLSFPSNVLTQYAQLLRPDLKPKILGTIPFYFHRSEQSSGYVEDTFEVVLPGGIKPAQRSYTPIYEAMQNVLKQVDKAIRLIFLGDGSPHIAKQVINKFRFLENKRFEVIYFNETVNQAIYEKHLNRSHLLILPLKPTFKNGIFYEKFGLSTISGTINDGLRHNKYMLVPEFYPISKDQSYLIHHYQDAKDLTLRILDFIQKNEPIRTPITHHIKQYGKKAMAEKLNQLVSSLNKL